MRWLRRRKPREPKEPRQCAPHKHQWDRPVDRSPSNLFQRIDCEKCGMAIDGARLRNMSDRTLRGLGRGLV